MPHQFNIPNSDKWKNILLLDEIDGANDVINQFKYLDTSVTTYISNPFIKDMTSTDILTVGSLVRNDNDSVTKLKSGGDFINYFSDIVINDSVFNNGIFYLATAKGVYSFNEATLERKLITNASEYLNITISPDRDTIYAISNDKVSSTNVVESYTYPRNVTLSPKGTLLTLGFSVDTTFKSSTINSFSIGGDYKDATVDTISINFSDGTNTQLTKVNWADIPNLYFKKYITRVVATWTIKVYGNGESYTLNTYCSGINTIKSIGQIAKYTISTSSTTYNYHGFPVTMSHVNSTNGAFIINSAGTLYVGDSFIATPSKINFTIPAANTINAVMALKQDKSYLILLSKLGPQISSNSGTSWSQSTLAVQCTGNTWSKLLATDDGKFIFLGLTTSPTDMSTPYNLVSSDGGVTFNKLSITGFTNLFTIITVLQKNTNTYGIIINSSSDGIAMYEFSDLSLFNKIQIGTVTTQTPLNNCIIYPDYLVGCNISLFRKYFPQNSKLYGIVQSVLPNKVYRIMTRGGISTIHTGLIPGKEYYLDETNTFIVCPTDKKPSGQAISSTELVLY